MCSYMLRLHHTAESSSSPVKSGSQLTYQTGEIIVDYLYIGNESKVYSTMVQREHIHKEVLFVI